MVWDPAEYHRFAMVHGIEFVQKLDNEGIIKFCNFYEILKQRWSLNE